MRPFPTALSIAGSDPSGGAGIQADLKTFADHGVYGMAVLTALTAQNTAAVSAVHPVPPEFVAEQLRMVLADLPVGAVKIGMLANAGVIRAVAAGLRDYPGPVVLDPVMVSTSGHRLLDPHAEETLLTELLPLATVVTPNLPEAELVLAGASPATFAQRTGVAILLKDGHNTEAVVRDLLALPDGRSQTSEHPRIPSRNTHGTGCTLSSAIAARLACGEPLERAVEGALHWLAGLIAASASHDLGAGHGPLLTGLVPPHGGGKSPL